MEDKFIKVDLHIHTPASPCYKGSKTDPTEYMKILRKALEEKIEVIAFTDHNSISGYKQLLSIHDDLKREKKYLLPIKDSKQAQDRLVEIEEDLQTFNSLLVLPGVEFQTSNSAHVLVIFDPKYDVSVIEKFLIDAGFDIESKDVNDSISRWCILDLLNNSSRYNCFCIDAHTDSDKGLYKTLIGKTRGLAFSNIQLKAIAYKSQDTISKIEALLTNREFKRIDQLSFVKFSDAHSVDTIGKHYTWMKLEPITYESIKVALGNPIECISIEEPETAKIINNLINDSKSVYVEKFDDYESITKSVIALANSEGGYCLIGVNENGGCKGVDYLPCKEDYDALIKQISPLWVTSSELLTSFNYYELQGKKYLISINTQPITGIVYYEEDEIVYTQQKNSFVKASPSYIEAKIEAELLNKMQRMIQPKIDNIESKLSFVKSTFDTLRIISKIRNILVPVSKYISVSMVESVQAKSNASIEKAFLTKKEHLNGLPDGNIIIINEALIPRYPYAYLRLTAPVFGDIENAEPNVLQNSIIITRNGCAFLVEKDSLIVSENMDEYLVLNVNCPQELTNKFTSYLVMYLKSTFLLWFVLSATESFNIFVSIALRKVRIPNFNFKNNQFSSILDRIHDGVCTIINKEKIFLESVIIQDNESKATEEFYKMAEDHNISVGKVFHDIDSEFYEQLHLKGDEIITIENRIKSDNMFVFDSHNLAEQGSPNIEANTVE